jgi:predicted Rossmann fold flavoprotein
MTHYEFDLIVVGAGAAGLMASIHAAERGKSVLLIERNRKPGVKILMSGGTRCNITHACSNREIVEAFGPNGKFLHSALAKFGVQQVIEFFEAEGVETKVEDTGKIFPVSDKAIDVLEALLNRLRRAGVKLSLCESVLELDRTETGTFLIKTDLRTVEAPKLLLCSGGKSFPGCGTRGDGYAWAEHFGHRIIPTHPALVPVTVQEKWIPDLKGLTIPDVSVRVMENGKALSHRRASFLFAHFGLSGPAPMDVSKAIVKHSTPSQLHIELDFLPDENEQLVEETLKQRSLSDGKKQLLNILPDQLPRRLHELVLQLAQLPLDRKASGLSKEDRRKIVVQLKRMQLQVRGTLGYEKAEVTTGGVSLDEVDSRTMQSKLVPGLYFAGEILDLDGPIGGYNFQSAWSTGWLAGGSI